jgi:hypothetical protein
VNILEIVCAWCGNHLGYTVNGKTLSCGDAIEVLVDEVCARSSFIGPRDASGAVVELLRRAPVSFGICPVCARRQLSVIRAEAQAGLAGVDARVDLLENPPTKTAGEK